MTWFAAHIVIGMKRRDGIGPISVYENVVLVEALSPSEARQISINMGKAEAEIDDTLTIGGQPAVRIFAGTRKIVNVSNPDSVDLDQDRPVSGTEITYSEFEVSDDAALQRFAHGETVEVRYLE